MQNTVKEKLLQIQQEIAPSQPRIIAITKYFDETRLIEAYEAGLRDFGENRVVDALNKFAKLPREIIETSTFHLVGHLQTNKVKYLIGNIALYHSCDRDDLANEIARQSLKKGIVSNVLIQINIGSEESKGGYDYDGAKETYLRLSQTQGLCVKGFMAMLPNTDDENALIPLIQKMRLLFDWAKTQSKDVEYLSMGMSGDYPLCIAHGSNMIRVGSTIFGARA